MNIKVFKVVIYQVLILVRTMQLQMKKQLVFQKVHQKPMEVLVMNFMMVGKNMIFMIVTNQQLKVAKSQ